MIKTQNKVKIIAITFFAIAFFLSAFSFVNAATYYVDDSAVNDTGDGSNNNPKKYITSALQLLRGGDTLIIKDGVYTGANNMIGDYAFPQVWPPSGLGPNQYTVIKAENIGGAVIDGEYQNRPFSTNNRATKVNYVRIEGIHFRRSSGGVFNIKGDFNKIIKCGFEDGQSSDNNAEKSVAFIAGGSSYTLVEDSWVWGKGRIGLYTSSTDGGTDHVIFRRVIVRLDDTPTRWVTAGILFYRANNNVCQNCIVIDSTPNSASKNTGAFETVRVAVDHSWLGSIALNNDHWRGFFPENSEGLFNVENSIFWRNGGNGWSVVSSSSGIHNINHVTTGYNLGSGMMSNSAYSTTENSLNSISLNNNNYGFEAIDNIDTVNVYGNSNGNCSGCSINNGIYTNPFTIASGYSEPALKYLPRIETNSNLKGVATDGGDIGANIIKRIGVSGTLYGEPGWDTVTNENLWPWPDEDIWTPKLRAYTASGPGGNRGFAASGNGLYGGPITLTSYIWEYLGNACPTEICDGDGGTIPPSTCTSFTYSNYSPTTCPASQTQTRTIATSLPSGCSGGTPESLTQSCTYIPSPTSIFSEYYEAESMILTSPMTIEDDVNASAGQYISPTTGSNSSNPKQEATLSITLPATDTYYIWAKIFGPDESSDAMYVGIDNIWDRIFPSTINVYEWVKVETVHNSGNYQFNLTEGDHTLQIGHGEINARIDTLFITNNPNEVPTNPSQPTLQGDLNSDNAVNSLDWSIMNTAWGTANSQADLNNDGLVNTIDFSIMNSSWSN